MFSKLFLLFIVTLVVAGEPPSDSIGRSPTDPPDLYEETEALLNEIEGEIGSLWSSLDSEVTAAEDTIAAASSNTTDDCVQSLEDTVSNCTLEIQAAVDNASSDLDLYECQSLSTHLTDIPGRSGELIATYLKGISRTSTFVFDNITAEVDYMNRSLNSLRRELNDCETYDEICILEVSLLAVKLQESIVNVTIGDISDLVGSYLNSIQVTSQGLLQLGESNAEAIKNTILYCISVIKRIGEPTTM